MSVDCFRETRRGGLVRPASKSGRFSHHPLRVPKEWHGDFAACGQRSGLLALNLGSIFEKLLHRKTFYLPAALSLQSRLFYFNAMFHVKHSEFVLRKTTRNQFGKAGAHPQLAWESQLPLKPYLSLQPSDFEGNCDSFDCFLDFCFIL